MATEWNERRVGDVLILDVSGALTMSEEFRDVFKNLYDRGEKKVLVNLAEVPYMDSTSVGDLVVGHLQASENDAAFKLLGMQPKLVELLTMHHLIQVFEIFDDEEVAVASFS